MTAREATNITKQALTESKIPYTRVKAKTVSFSDLARGERVFVTVYGWEKGYQSPSRYAFLSNVAHKAGFSIDNVLEQE